MTQKISPTILDVSGIPAGAYLANVMGVAQWIGLQVDLASQISGKLPLSSIDVSGTAAANTFLRGDGTWATPADMAASWGQISGSITNQTDLISLLAGKQNADATLSALAALDGTTGVLEQIGPDAFSKREIGVSSSSSLLTRGAADARFASLTHNHTTDDIVGLNDFLATPAPHTHTVSDITGVSAFIATLLDDANASAARSTLGLGTAAIENADSFAEAVHSHDIFDVTGLEAILETKEDAIVEGQVGQYLRGDKTWATLNKGAVGLSAVDNTSDMDKPISFSVQTALSDKLDNSHAGIGGGAHTLVSPNGAAGFMSGGDKAKLDGVAAGATANSTDASLRARSSHTGTQHHTTIVMAPARLLGRTSTGDGEVETITVGSGIVLNSGALSLAAEVADIEGLVAALDEKLDESLVSSFALSLLDDITATDARSTLGLGSAATFSSASFAAASHGHSITDIGGLSAALAAREFTIPEGEVTQYYRGDKTWATLDKSVIGLSAVDNTSDANKPISTAVAGALALKAPLHNPTFTGAVNLPRDPEGPLEAATKQYVDQVAQGLAAKESVQVATTGNIVLTGEQIIDGVLTEGSRVLVKDQINSVENGIYVSSSGGWTRAVDMDAWNEIPSAFVFIQQGTSFSNTGWVCVADIDGDLDITPIYWAQFSGAGTYTAGTGIIKNGSEFALAPMPSLTLKGNATGSAAAPTNLTAEQVTSILAIFTASAKGLVPASGGGTDNYLRADGTWAEPISGAWGNIGGNIEEQNDLAAVLATKENVLAPATAQEYYRGDKTWAVLNKTAVGLSNVDNTSDLNKPISAVTQVALDGKLAQSHHGSGGTAHAEATASTAGFMSATDKSKLQGIEAQATKNSSDAFLLTRNNHTGQMPYDKIDLTGNSLLGRSQTGIGAVQPISIGGGLLLSGGVLSANAHIHQIADVTGLQAALDSKLNAAGSTAFGQSFIASENASDARTLLALGSAALRADNYFAVATTTQTALDARQPLSSMLTSLAGMGSTTGLVEQTGTTTFAKRLIGAATNESILSRLAADGRYALIAHNHDSVYAALGHNHDSQYAVLAHVHTISNVTGLQSALDGKINTSASTATGLSILGAANAEAVRTLLALGTAALAQTTDFAPAAHAHSEYALLAHTHNNYAEVGHTHNYAEITHTHEIANVTGLQAALDSKAAAIHAHAVFSTNTAGFVPASGSNTEKFLRGDGTWQTVSVETGGGAWGEITGNIADQTDLQTALNAKANTVHGHAVADVTGLQTALDGKAAAVHSHAVADVTGLQSALDGKAATVHVHGISDVTGLQAALNAKEGTISAGTALQYWRGDKQWATLDKTSVGLANVDNTSDINKPISTATQTALNTKLNASEKGVANGVATLGSDAKIPTSQLPALALTDVFVVASQAAHLSVVAQEGDVVVRTDLNKSFIHNGGTAGTMADWQELLTPTDQVLSVNGQTGAVNLTKADVGLSNVDNTADLNKPVSTAVQTALDAKAASVHNHAIGDVTGLQSALDGKASTVHGHAIADVTGLQGALDGKASTVHSHGISDVTGLQGALDGKASSVHGHGISDVTGLQGALDGKASTVHSHGISDVTGLTPELSSKAPLADPTFTGAVTLGRNPEGELEAATKSYVDTIAQQGVKVRQAVDLATTGNLVLSGEQTVDGVMTSSSRVLVKNQTNAVQNGVYITSSGAWSRATDMDDWTEVPGSYFFVQGGVSLANSGWTVTSSGSGTIGSTPIQFEQFSSAGNFTASGGIAKVGSDFRLADMPATTIRGNASGSTAAPTNLTATQVTALLNNFTNALKGLVPASGGGTTNFLRADGSWASPPNTGVWGQITGTLSSQTDLNTALNAKESTISSGTTAQYWRGDKVWAALNKTAVGLANVDNTSDADKPVSTATQTALNAKLNSSAAGAFGLSILATANAAAATALIDTFTVSAKGLVPAPSSSTGRYLRDDGTWANIPAGVTTFQGLTDAADYVSGDANKVVKVNSTGTGIDFGVVLGTAASMNSTAFAAASHTHAISDITNLQSSLNAKLNSSAVSAWGLSLIGSPDEWAAHTVLGLGTAATADAAAFAEATHTHIISDITGLSTQLANKEPTISSGTSAQYWRGDKTWQALTKASVGLGNVDNTSDLLKPISTATQTALDGKASLSGATFSGTVTLAGDPTIAMHATTKQYVDGVAQGLDVKQSVLVATTLTVSLNGEQTIDGIPTSASRVLVKNQASPSQNGIYVTSASAWTRALDMDSWSEVPGAFVFVERGTQADTGWVCTSDAGGTLGTTAIEWTQFSGAGAFTASNGITQTGTNFTLTNMSAGTIKGRATGAGTGSPADLSASDVKAILALTKSDVGLSNVDNTSDADKPVSSATLTALNAKANLSGATFTGAISATNLSGTNTGDQTITLTGPITGSGTGSFVTSITNNAVTLAKLAQLDSARFLGRASAGTGDVESLTSAQVTALLNNFTPTVKGLVPPSGGGSNNYLRADGTWDDPLAAGASPGWAPVTATGTGASQNITLPASISNASDILVFVNGVLQEPTTHYTASDTTVTLTAELGDSIFVCRPGSGLRGAAGETGTAATIDVGSVSTLSAGASATVTNVGSTFAATLNFGIPRGDKGDKGDSASIALGTVATGSAGTNVSITNSGTTDAAIFNFTIPRGDTGAVGPGATVAIGTTSTGTAGTSAAVTNTGTSTNATLNFTIPRGDTGAAATIALGSVATGTAGSNVAITNSGTSGAAVFNFTIPRGDQGIQGSAGTIAVGSVSTGAAGTNAAITNSGTSTAATLDFTIPRGDQGIQGTPGVNAILGWTGGIDGVMADNEVFMLGYAPTAITLTQANCIARAITAPTGGTTITIRKQTGANAPTTVGTITWTGGNAAATVTISAASILANDMVWLAGPATADTTLANIAYMIRA
jgi:hypothetical protein